MIVMEKRELQITFTTLLLAVQRFCYGAVDHLIHIYCIQASYSSIIFKHHIKWSSVSFKYVVVFSDAWQRRYTEIVAIDAKHYRGNENQFGRHYVLRELNKVSGIILIQCIPLFSSI